MNSKKNADALDILKQRYSFLNELALDTADFYYEVIRKADECGFDRAEALTNMFDMLIAIDEEVDPEEFDLDDTSHLS